MGAVLSAAAARRGGAQQPVSVRLRRRWGRTAALRWGVPAGSLALLVLCTAALAAQSYNPFLYFRF